MNSRYKNNKAGVHSKQQPSKGESYFDRYPLHGAVILEDQEAVEKLLHDAPGLTMKQDNFLRTAWQVALHFCFNADILDLLSRTMRLSEFEQQGIVCLGEDDQPPFKWTCDLK